jgi:hypothetical protein
MQHRGTRYLRRSGAAAIAALAFAALTAVGGPPAGASSSTLCKDYAALAKIRGTSVAKLKAASRAYSKLAAEAPASAKADLKFLAAAELQVASGNAASVDNNAARAAAQRADAIVSKKCRG